MPTWAAFHFVSCPFSPRSGSMLLTKTTSHWPYAANFPDPELGPRGARAWDGHVKKKLGHAQSRHSDRSLQIPMNGRFCAYQPFQTAERSLKTCVCPGHSTSRGSRWRGTYSGANRGRRTTNDAEKMVFFSSNVILIQLLRYNSVRTYPLVILVMVVCPTKIFLSDFFYSGALLVHWRRVIERVAGHDALYGSSSVHRIVIGTEIFFLVASSNAAFWQISSNTLYEQMCQLGGHTKFVFLFQNIIFARSVFGPNPTGQHFYVPRSATRPPGWKAKASQMFGAAARALSGVFECNARHDPSYLLPAGR